MRDEKIASYLKPLPTSKEIETLFDLIEKSRNNPQLFKSLINDIISGNFHFYKKDSKPPERLPFNESLFDKYVIDKYEATAKHYKNNFGTNLIDYLERFSKCIDDSIHKKNGLKKVEYDLNINSELINKFIEYYKNTYDLKGAPVRKCTCTLEDRTNAFKNVVSALVDKEIKSFFYSIKHLTDHQKKILIQKEVETYDAIFSTVNEGIDNNRYRLHYKTEWIRYISVWKEFRRSYDKRMRNEFKNFHLEACPAIQPYINEDGETFTPNLETIKNKAWFPYAYFFYERLKEYYEGNYGEKLDVKEKGTKESDAKNENPLNPKQVIRNDFLRKLNEEYNFSSYNNPEINNDILNKEIPYIFALFKKIGYRQTLEDFYPKGKKRNEMYKMLSKLLDMNDRDIAGYWRCLEDNSKENLNNNKTSKYNSNLYLKDIPESYIKNQ